jgi:hypothetical protein
MAAELFVMSTVAHLTTDNLADDLWSRSRERMNMPWEHATTIRWVSDLGAPSHPSIYRFKGAAVLISDEHIQRAETQLANGATDVIFNATYCELACGERQVEAGGIAAAL